MSRVEATSLPVELIINLTAPTHNATSSATIGTLITGTAGVWQGSPTITHQWQRNTGSWVDISGATSINYTPVDADFGYTLRRLEIPDGVTAQAEPSAPTAAVAEVPVQTIGSELLTNGDFSAWTTDNPNGWTVSGEVASDPMVTQVASSGGAGTGAARFYASTATFLDIMAQTDAGWTSIVAEINVNMTARTAGTFIVRAGNGALATGSAGVMNAVRQYRGFGPFRHSSLVARFHTPAPHDIVLDSISMKAVTLNTQLTAPSANMRLDFFYTLPGSPADGDCVWLLPRISDFAAGNYWLGWLRYTGTQWDVNLYSVVSHTRTSRTNAANIGATDGFRINMNGSSLSMFTRTGGVWTQRGSTVSFSTYSTAMACNVLYTSDIVAGNLEYAPAA